MFCPLGMGVIDFKSIIEILGANKNNTLYAVECDGWDGDPAKGAAITYEYLKKNL